jgi:hypothetical protein
MCNTSVRMVLALFAVLAASGGCGQINTAAPAERSRAPERTVPCTEAIDLTRFPYIGNRRPEHRYRLVLGVVALPAFMAPVYKSAERRWPYWRKQGIVVRASGESVTITVPPAWRERAAIAWGNGGNGEPFSSLRIAGCRLDKTVGNAYAGGFYLRSRTACLPLTFRVGNRTATIRVGLGRRCHQPES